MAVNAMLVPGQTGVLGFAVMETDGTTGGFTVIVIVLDVAVVGEAQVALEVMITLTTSPLFKLLDVKVAPPPPAFTPFTCH